MSREVYEQIDVVREAVYKLVDQLQRLPGNEGKWLARHAYIELNPSYESLADLGGELDRIRSAEANRPSGTVETGHASGTLPASNVIGGNLSNASRSSS